MTTDTETPELPLQKEWKVLAVREGKKEPNPKGGGELQKFHVDFEGVRDVYWRRKLPATVDVGEMYFGTISEGDYGPIFKKESPGGPGGSGGFRPNGGASQNGVRSSRPEPQDDPERAARIGRSHAQRLAVELLRARDALTDDEESVKASIESWADWLVADVDQAGEKAKPQGSGE